jgi:hypothetical protein
MSRVVAWSRGPVAGVERTGDPFSVGLGSVDGGAGPRHSPATNGNFPSGLWGVYQSIGA